MSGMNFRKKPVIITSWQFDGTLDSWEEIDRENPNLTAFVMAAGHSFIQIETPEGTMLASQGDWIIRGLAGEIYPCKPDIFAATYEYVG